jgi:coproporphyrinogen III oxidase-like Fe-S oxidoreductase
LTELFDLIDRLRTGPAPVPAGVPTAVETSPATATPDRLAVLAQRGTTRISIGVQSFLDAEARAAGRPQRRTEVEQALAAIRDQPIPELNIDLIYGIPGQTPASWEQSLAAALRWAPEELFLYPLYVRPLTGLSRRGARHDRSADAPAEQPDPQWDDQRQRLYRQGVDRLRAAGYRQLSMRHFRRATLPFDATPEYSCQSDGMVGLGCGARSYTADLHYSFDYAVSVSQVRAIIDDYLARPESDFDLAEVGFRLDAGEQRRRWLITSLLRADGCDQASYTARFASRVVDDFSQLELLADRGWLTADADRLVLTDAGLAHSDAIGPWLVSEPVRAAMTSLPAR